MCFPRWKIWILAHDMDFGLRTEFSWPKWRACWIFMRWREQLFKTAIKWNGGPLFEIVIAPLQLKCSLKRWLGVICRERRWRHCNWNGNWNERMGGLTCLLLNGGSNVSVRNALSSFAPPSPTWQKFSRTVSYLFLTTHFFTDKTRATIVLTRFLKFITLATPTVTFATTPATPTVTFSITCHATCRARYARHTRYACYVDRWRLNNTANQITRTFAPFLAMPFLLCQ